MSPVLPLLDENFEHKLVHTGQHYDYNMDKIFFEELKLRAPDYNLNVGSGTHAEQTAKMMLKIEKILMNEKPDAVIVFADPNTPLAGVIVASKLGMLLIHLESGLRAYNKSIPEEINRIVADHCSDILLTPRESHKDNLVKEGLNPDDIFVVGSTASEACLRNLPIAEDKSGVLEKLGVSKTGYLVLTAHRAGNTDNASNLREILEAANLISENIKIVFPVHPRTKKAISENKITLSENIIISEPLGYLDFLKLINNARFILSDSGGIQEEAATLNVPCLILRDKTEWTHLTDAGKNRLVGAKKDTILEAVDELMDDDVLKKIKNINIELDKNVSDKIVSVIKNVLDVRQNESEK